MSYGDDPPGCGFLAVLAVICIGVMFWLIIEVHHGEEKCEARGGTPVVDRWNEVRCLEVPAGR